MQRINVFIEDLTLEWWIVKIWSYLQLQTSIGSLDGKGDVCQIIGACGPFYRDVYMCE